MVMLTDWAMAAVGSATGVIINRLKISPSGTNKFLRILSSMAIGGENTGYPKKPLRLVQCD
jgi:hypothetical protein